jgi:hypothetical protein
MSLAAILVIGYCCIALLAILAIYGTCVVSSRGWSAKREPVTEKTDDNIEFVSEEYDEETLLEPDATTCQGRVREKMEIQ